MESASDGLERELHDLIVETCHIPDPPEEILPDAPLVGPDSPLELDSLDAVEIVVEIQKHYNVRIGGQEASREVMRSLRVLADYIRAHRP